MTLPRFREDAAGGSWSCLCPSCHKKRELLWAHWAGEQLLEDVPHRQVVFSIAKRLRIFFRYDRKLLGELAGCAWRAIRLYFQVYFNRDDIYCASGIGEMFRAFGVRQIAPATRELARNSRRCDRIEVRLGPPRRSGPRARIDGMLG